jgi:hypothetical protein
MCDKQLGFSDFELTTDKKQTMREKFLAEMEALVPCEGEHRSTPLALHMNPLTAGA